MDKETLRMQMLSGVITESEYKAKLEENAEKELTYNDFVRMVRNDMMAGASPDEYPSDEQIKNKAKAYYNEYLQGTSVDDLFETKSKDSLNEHYIAGGIVGIGAINQIPSRAKADYEDAFEHFLGQKYGLNEMGDDKRDSGRRDKEDWNTTDRKSYEEREKERREEEKKMDRKLGRDSRRDPFLEETDTSQVYEGEVNENIGSTIDKILSSFEFSQKGNDEMIELANYILSPEGAKNIAMSIKSRLKGEGGEKYFTSDPEALNTLLSKLGEGKEVEEPENY